MTAVFITGLCIAGFVLGFLALFTFRRRFGATSQTSKGTQKAPAAPEKTVQAACPWCGKKDYNAANPAFTCPECKTAHHKSHWEEYGGCAMWDCRLAPAPKDAKKTI